VSFSATPAFAGRDTLQKSRPYDTVVFPGGADDCTRESVRFGKSLVRPVGFILEQKETKETKKSIPVVYG
jgi:hypothetical protein